MKTIKNFEQRVAGFGAPMECIPDRRYSGEHILCHRQDTLVFAEMGAHNVILQVYMDGRTPEMTPYRRTRRGEARYLFRFIPEPRSTDIETAQEWAWYQSEMAWVKTKGYVLAKEYPDGSLFKKPNRAMRRALARALGSS